MRTRIYTLVALISAFITVGCQKEIVQDNQLIPQTKTVWQRQLDSVINTPPTILKASNISLLSYELIENLDNPTKTVFYKAKLKSSEDMMPCYTSASFNRITAISKSEAARTKSDFQSYTFERLDQFIDSIVSQGMQIVELKWNNNGVPTKTLCAVSDKDGVVYDNFISNAIVLDTPTVTTTEKQTKQVGTKVWTLTNTATWLWGSERGQATITHSAYCTGHNIMYHNFSASHYMSVGNSEAKVAEVEKADTYATITYAYGLSTPGISVYVRFVGQYLTVEFSAMLGSTIGGSGQHTIHVNDQY